MPLGPLQIVMSLLYGLLTAVLLWLQARKLVVYVEASHATLCRPVCMTWPLSNPLLLLCWSSYSCKCAVMSFLFNDDLALEWPALVGHKRLRCELSCLAYHQAALVSSREQSAEMGL